MNHYVTSPHHLSHQHPVLANVVTTRWIYAPAGNLLAIQTDKLSQNNTFIEYQYNHGRLSHVAYPDYPENDVYYYYDCAGRIGVREDGVGREELKYDELGNINYSLRRVLVPTDAFVYHFETRHKYDSFGKIQYIIYPDQDSVAYDYMLTGELASVSHGLQGHSANFLINDLAYDEFGHKIHQKYGNNVETDYTYDMSRQWLSQLVTYLPSSGTYFQDLWYSYDPVGNIIEINQYSSALSGLGGEYYNTYTYDAQNRLISSYGSATAPFGYDFSMSYSPSGRLGHNSCGANIVNKKLKYGYDEDFLTHQPRVVYDTVASESYNLYWDANGNLQEVSNCKMDVARFHDWDEENRLRAIVGPKHAGLYGYDGNGNRVWKLTGDCEQTSQNGGYVGYNVTLDDAVLYPNPYLTVTPLGYTKHYYLGTERIATAIGEGELKTSPDYLDQREEELVFDYWHHFKIYDPFGTVEEYKGTNIDIEENDPNELQYNCSPFQLSFLQLAWSDMFGLCMNTYSNSTGLPESTFFTHNDHLGSASWITDGTGVPVQYIHYAPYGELLADQKPTGSTYDERYKFTGKERDAESGYDFYGARFFGSALGHWLSVDQLADKYPGISPYAYCNWNPIKFVDPDGRWITFAPGTSAAQKEQFWQAVRYLDSHDCGGRYGQLRNSTQKYIINMNAGKSQFDGHTNRENPVIYWEPDMGYEMEDGVILSPATILNHEFTHATHFDDAKKQLDAGNVEAWNKYAQTTYYDASNAYGSKEEESVITGIEQRTAQKLGEVEPGQATRTNHSGKPVSVENSTSNKKTDDF